MYACTTGNQPDTLHHRPHLYLCLCLCLCPHVRLLSTPKTACAGIYIHQRLPRRPTQKVSFPTGGRETGVREPIALSANHEAVTHSSPVLPTTVWCAHPPFHARMTFSRFQLLPPYKATVSFRLFRTLVSVAIGRGKAHAYPTGAVRLLSLECSLDAASYCVFTTVRRRNRETPPLPPFTTKRRVGDYCGGRCCRCCRDSPSGGGMAEAATGRKKEQRR